MSDVGKIFGLISLVIGILFSSTIIGAVIGIPMIIVGAILLIAG